MYSYQFTLLQIYRKLAQRVAFDHDKNGGTWADIRNYVRRPEIQKLLRIRRI